MDLKQEWPEGAVSRVDEVIYINRPELIKLNGDDVAFKDFEEALAEDAKGATAITILGGYFNPDELIEICLNVPAKPKACRQACRVRIVVGLDRYNGMIEVWEKLRDVQAVLRREGFRDLSIGVIPPFPVHFHTKVFGFIKTTYPIWYVGSANPGSERHEIMVRVVGRHDALVGYADTAVARAMSIESEPPTEEISNLREFFLSGSLVHKPPVQRLFAYDAFRFSAPQRAALDDLASQGLDVPHARPRTEGYGFSLLSALDVESFPDSRPDDGDTQRVRYRESAIDTVLGYWMPETYARNLHAKFRSEEFQREEYLKQISALLNSHEQVTKVMTEYADHVSGMQDFLDSNEIDALPSPDHQTGFKKFLDSRTRLLADDDARSRHARVMTLTPMPDIWQDQEASSRFEESFFADLAYRAGPITTKKGRVIRSMMDAVGGYSYTGEDFREALEHRLATSPWTNVDWID